MQYILAAVPYLCCVRKFALATSATLRPLRRLSSPSIRRSTRQQWMRLCALVCARIEIRFLFQRVKQTIYFDESRKRTIDIVRNEKKNNFCFCLFTERSGCVGTFPIAAGFHWILFSFSSFVRCVFVASSERLDIQLGECFHLFWDNVAQVRRTAQPAINSLCVRASLTMSIPHTIPRLHSLRFAWISGKLKSTFGSTSISISFAFCFLFAFLVQADSQPLITAIYDMISRLRSLYARWRIEFIARVAQRCAAQCIRLTKITNVCTKCETIVYVVRLHVVNTFSIAKNYV